MTLTPMTWRTGGRLVSLALLGSVALNTGAHAAPVPPTTYMAEATEDSQTWLTLQRPLLCATTVTPTSFSRRCTTHWYLDARRQPVSDDPAWVPIESAILDASDGEVFLPHWLLRATRPTVRQGKRILPRIVASAAAAPWTGAGTGGSGPYGLWNPPPGYHAYAMADYAGDPNAAFFGVCTWYAQYRRQDERLMDLGNAWQWAFTAASHGLRTGSAPAVGATVVFQPGVEGAGGAGHVAHVEAVYTGGWFLISEMNMAWNGGGWGRVSYRYALVAPGVSFIY